MTSFMKTIVASAVRLEYNSTTGELLVIFKVVDEKFKREMMDDFSKNVDLVLIGKDLIKE